MNVSKLLLFPAPTASGALSAIAEPRVKYNFLQKIEAKKMLAYLRDCLGSLPGIELPVRRFARNWTAILHACTTR